MINNILQAEYNKEIYEIETIFIYDGYISLYKGELNVNGSFTVKLTEVKILFDDYSVEQVDIYKCPECGSKMTSSWSGVRCTKCNYFDCY